MMMMMIVECVCVWKWNASIHPLHLLIHLILPGYVNTATGMRDNTNIPSLILSSLILSSLILLSLYSFPYTLFPNTPSLILSSLILSSLILSSLILSSLILLSLYFFPNTSSTDREKYYYIWSDEHKFSVKLRSWVRDEIKMSIYRCISIKSGR